MSSWERNPLTVNLNKYISIQKETIVTLKAEVETLKADKAILERRMLLGADFLVEFLNKYMVLYHANKNLFTVAECDELEADLAVLCQKFGITLGKQEE